MQKGIRARNPYAASDTGGTAARRGTTSYTKRITQTVPAKSPAGCGIADKIAEQFNGVIESVTVESARGAPRRKRRVAQR